jgi:hypothetical protein
MSSAPARGQQRRAHSRFPVQETGGEPAFRRAFHHHRRARGADQLGPFPPARRLADLRSGAEQHRGPDPLRCVEQQLQTDRTADRVAGVPKTSAVGQRQHRLGQLRNGERAGRWRAVPVAGQIPGENVEPAVQ